MKFSSREEVIIHFKARFFLGPAVDAANIGEKIEAGIGRSFQKPTRSLDAVACDCDRDFTVSVYDLVDPFRVLTLQRRHQQ